MRTRPAAAAALAALAFAGGCGDDDEDEPAREAEDRTSRTTATDIAPAPGDTESAETDSEQAAPAPAEPAPEEQQGGAGDEEPARSLASVTGRGGRVSPRLVLVPPYISIRVELRSADGREYALSGGGRSLRVDRDIAAASTTFDGLRPGRRLVLRGPQGRVAVEASAEPGP